MQLDRSKLSRIIVSISPFFAALLLVSPRRDLGPAVLQLYALYLFLFLAWKLARNSWGPELFQKLSRASARERVRYLQFFVFTLLTLAALGALHQKVDQRFSAVTVLALAVSALGELSLRRNRDAIALFCTLTFFTAAGYLTFAIFLQQWIVQPILFCLGLASNATFAWTLRQRSELTRKTAPILITSALVAIGALCFINALPAKYFSVMLIIIVGYPFLTAIRELKRGHALSTELVAYGESLSVLFVALLLLLRLL